MDEYGYITINEAAAYLRFSRAHLVRFIRAGQLPAIRVLFRYRIAIADLLAVTSRNDAIQVVAIDE